jgi:hypothetical protein
MTCYLTGYWKVRLKIKSVYWLHAGKALAECLTVRKKVIKKRSTIVGRFFGVEKE